MSNVKLKDVRLSDLVECGTQPKHRANRVDDDAAIVSLIRHSGIIHPLWVVPDGNGKFIVADGHRRWKAATILGLACVPCMIYDTGMTAEELMIIANVGTDPFWPRDTFKGWAQSEDKDTFLATLKRSKPTMHSNISETIKIFGTNRTATLAIGGLKPNCHTTVKRIRSALEFAVAKSVRRNKDQSSIPTLRQIGEWIVSQAAWTSMGVWLSTRGPESTTGTLRLLGCIQNGKPFPRSIWL